VIFTGAGRARRAGSGPTVGGGVVSAARVQRREIASPDYHFSAGPHCCVIYPSGGRASGTGSCPRVVRAVNGRTPAP
jgi:hypothetical protein